MVAMKLFCFYNKVHQNIDGVAMDVTAGMCIRNQSSQLYRVNNYFVDDLELREYGTINENGSFTPCPNNGFIVHSWDEYKNPEQNVVKVEPKKQAQA